MKKPLLDYGILKEIISKSNVLAMAELIALSEMRWRSVFMMLGSHWYK